MEREFRGFGRVDQTDAERVGATHGKGLFPDYPDPINGETPLPPILTKTWFSTGAWRERSAQTAAYAAEQWTGDSAAPAVPGPLLPTDLPADELPEAHRAHRGQLLRQEIYALDGTPDEAHPYLVTGTAVEIRRLQPRHSTNSKRPALPGVFHLVERETRTWAYDRDPADPRLNQTLALDVDPYGAVTRSAALAYPRRFTSTHPEQNALHCVVDETDLLHLDATPDGHRLAIPLEARTYHLTGQTPPLLGAPLERASVRQSFLGATEIAPHESPTSGLQKRLLGREKARYYQSSALPALHPFGQADPRALLYQTYQLDLTDALITQVYGSKLTPAILAEGHYLTPPGETGHWIPSDVATFEPAQFYLPSSFTDPFGAVTSVQYDAHRIFPTEITDDLGNTTSAEHDYAALQPAQTTDPNGNRTQARYNALGLLTEIALMGKIGSSDGDTLADPTIKLSYDLTPASGTPRSVKTEAREKHGPSNTRWHTTIDYTTGAGGLAMTKVQCEPGDAPQRDANGNLILPIQQAHSDPRWIGTGRTVRNNKGAPLKQYEPYFSSTPAYETEPELTDTGVTPVLTYDSLGRLVRTDLPNGSYSRVDRSPWQLTTHDPNDTLTEPGNLWRAARQPGASPTPSAAEQRARQLAEAHAETPTDLHLDPLGRPFLAVSKLTPTTLLETRTKLDIQGRTLEIKDPLGRTCQTHAYSLTGRLLRETNIDKGTRWTFQAIDGVPLRRWDDRDQTFRTQHDALRRPTHQYLKIGAAPETLLQRTLYGESHPSPEAQNLRGKPIRHYDEAGALKSESYDFKGNPLETQRRLAQAFTAATDWTPLAATNTPSAIDAAAASLLETETFTQTRTFDALNRIASATEPDQTELKPRYNQRGLLDKVEARIRNSVTWTPFVDDIQYDAKAQRQSIDYGNGTATAYQYDELTYRLLHLTTTRTSPSNTLQDLSYTFDPVGNILQITDAAQQTLFYNNSVVLPQNLFEYDALYRLVSATGREHASIGDVQVDHNDLPLQNLPHNNDASAVRTYLEEYQYDAVGNILEMFHEAAGTPVATWTRAYTYAVGTNRLATNTIPGGTATYTHDPHGNLLSMPHLASIDWTPFDQIRTCDLGGGGDVFFTYASDGQRVRKVWQQTATAVKERIYLGAYEIYREKLSGVTQLERQTLHVMDGVQRIAMVETKTVEGAGPIATPVPKQRFQLGNHLGSAMLEVDETGLIISYEEYHPYGTSAYRSARSGVEVSARRYRNTGKERDDETGLYYHGARYYAAWLGRWTSADPLGIGADGPGLYNYTRGSPIVYSDPSGTDSVDDQAATVAAHQQLAEQEYHRYLAEQYVQHDLETGQTIDPSIGVEVPEAVHPQVAFANEMLANIDARLAAERADALTGEGGASSELAEMAARDPFAGASGQSAQPGEIGPMTDAELGFWQTLGGAYLGARIPSGPAHAVGALTLASAESHDDPSFVLGTMAVLPGMPAVSQALDRAAGAAADLAYQSAFVFTGTDGLGAAPAKVAGGVKAINLPTWSKVSVATGHILERHVPGARFAAGRTVFPSLMNEKGIMRAIREAYQTSRKVGVQGTDRVLLRGQGSGLTIEMWFNKATNTIETAYPVTP